MQNKGLEAILGTIISTVATAIPSNKGELEQASKQISDLLNNLKGSNSSTAEEFAAEFFTEKEEKKAKSGEYKSPNAEYMENLSSEHHQIINGCNLAIVETKMGLGDSEFTVTRDRLFERVGMTTSMNGAFEALYNEKKVWIKLLDGRIIKNY